MNTDKFTKHSYPDWKSLFFEAMENCLCSEFITLDDYNKIGMLFVDMEHDARNITHFYADMGSDTYEADGAIPEDDGKTASYCVIHSGLATNMMNILRTIDYDCKAFGVDHPLGLPDSLQELIWLAIKITTDSASELNKFTVENPQATSEGEQKVYDEMVADVKKNLPLPDHRPITFIHQLEKMSEEELEHLI